MSTASASRTIKFISRVGAINTRIQCNMGDLFQRYTGTASAPTAHIPDFASMAVKPMLEFQCFTSRLNAQGESIADVSAFKASINGQEIVFDGTTKKSIGVKNADGTTNTNLFAGYFELVTPDYPTGTQRYYGIRILKNLVAACNGTSARFSMEGNVTLGNVTETAAADYTVAITPKVGSGDNTVFIASGNSNGFTITSGSGAGSSVILKAIVYDGHGVEVTPPSGSPFSYQWYKLDPTKTGNDPWTAMTGETAQTLTVNASQVNNEAEYKVVVKHGTNEIGFDVQAVYDEGDDLIIDPHPNPADETISDSAGGNQSVTYTPAVFNRKTNANDTRPWTFTFMVRSAAGVPLNTDVNSPHTSFTVTLAHCQAENSDVSLIITATCS